VGSGRIANNCRAQTGVHLGVSATNDRQCSLDLRLATYVPESSVRRTGFKKRQGVQDTHGVNARSPELPRPGHYERNGATIRRVRWKSKNLILGITLLAAPVAAIAEEKDVPPLVSVAVRETFDAWAVPAGVDPSTAILSKFQLSGTLSGDKIGLPGWSAHAQIFRFDGQSLSSHLGDIQTADNLEAVPFTRLFEAWLARQWGKENRSIALRVGLIDLNSQFDSVDPASFFINSSHGIAPDLSRSGANGPSIYPVSSAGMTLTAVPSSRWTLRVGLFDGVPGDPERPRAFVAQRFGRHDGLLTIGQVDYQLSKDSRVEGGVWRYSAAVPSIDGCPAHDVGAYASIEAPVPVGPRVTGWVRAGLADKHTQTVAGYLGLGAVQQGTFSGRPDDRLGFAIAHAVIGSPAVDAFSLHRAETSFEVSYQVKISERVAVQPDVQYIHHPAGIANAPDALGIGLRLVLSTGFPKKPQANDPADPTVPPDGAPTTAPADAPNTANPASTPAGLTERAPFKNLGPTPD
jgi:porin